MYIDLLKQYASHLSTFKIQPPAANEEIQKAEKELGILFPKELKDLLLETNGDNFLFRTLKQIVEDNLDLRRLNPDIIEFELFNFSEYLFIGTNGCGDYYGYKIENGAITSTNFYVFEHEEYISRPVAHDLAGLIKLYYQDKI